MRTEKAIRTAFQRLKTAFARKQVRKNRAKRQGDGERAGTESAQYVFAF